MSLSTAYPAPGRTSHQAVTVQMLISLIVLVVLLAFMALFLRFYPARFPISGQSRLIANSPFLQGYLQ